MSDQSHLTSVNSPKIEKIRLTVIRIHEAAEEFMDYSIFSFYPHYKYISWKLNGENVDFLYYDEPEFKTKFCWFLKKNGLDFAKLNQKRDNLDQEELSNNKT